MKWRPSAWKRLLELVLPALDELPDSMDWTLGGGTGLAITLNHRISYDIDIFFEHAAVLRRLSPNANPKIRQLSDNWQQPGHYLKIERPEGDIDFLVTRSFTETPYYEYGFQGRTIHVETPIEIISKKIHFRGSQFTVRDIFDFAAFSVIDNAPSIALLPDVGESLPRALHRVKLLQKRYETTVQEAVNPTPEGEKFLTSGFDRAVSFLESIL
jgi:hypothetical protein